MTDAEPPTAPTAGTARVVLRCDADAAGAHRLLRCLALAEELASRGVTVTLACDTAGLPWADLQIRARGLDCRPPGDTPDEYVDLLDSVEADAAVFDSAALTDDVLAAVHKTGRPTFAIDDGPGGANQADVFVDPNVGAEDDVPATSAATRVLAGVDYALMRNDVLANRPISPPRSRGVEVPRVTVLLDETDTERTGAVIAQVLVGSGRPFEATFVAPGERTRSAVASVRVAPRQRIDVAEPTPRVHERAARSDVVLAAAGHAVYEWLCLGAAVGLVWDAEADVETYRRLMVHRAVVGLGATADLERDPGPGVEKVTRLLSDARERARLGEAGWRLVDGLGRARVADVLQARL